MTTPRDGEPDGWDQPTFSFSTADQEDPARAPGPPPAAPALTSREPDLDAAFAALAKPLPLAAPAPTKAHYWWALLGVLGGIIGFVQLKDRANQMAWRVLMLGLVATVVSVFVGALSVASSPTSVAPSAALATGTDPTYEPNPQNTYVAPTSQYTTPPTTSAPLATAVRVGGQLTGRYSFTPRSIYQFDYTDEFGYTSQIRLGFGPVGRYGSAVYGERDPGTCGLDEQTDAVVPFAVESINTTQGFDQRVRYDINPGVESRPSSGRPVERVMFYGSGPSCDTWDGDGSYGGDSIDAVSSDALAVDEFSSAQGYLILRDYYTPAAPGGDLAWAQGLTATAGNYIYSSDDGSSGTLTVTSCDGPGVTFDEGSYGNLCTLPFGASL